MLIKGQLQPLKNSAPDPAEVWNDPIASFFFHKSTWKELDFTGDQIEKITAMKSKRVRLHQGTWSKVPSFRKAGNRCEWKVRQRSVSEIDSAESGVVAKVQ